MYVYDFEAFAKKKKKKKILLYKKGYERGKMV